MVAAVRALQVGSVLERRAGGSLVCSLLVALVAVLGWAWPSMVLALMVPSGSSSAVSLGWKTTICFFRWCEMAAEVPGNDSAFLVSNGSAGGSGSALKGATGVRMATEVPGNDSASWSNGSAGGNGSALKGATGVRMATEVPGNVSASWRSLGF